LFAELFRAVRASQFKIVLENADIDCEVQEVVDVNDNASHPVLVAQPHGSVS